jgi:hypothetical protein
MIVVLKMVCNRHFIHKKLVSRGFLEYVANAHGSWFLMKGAPHERLLPKVDNVDR